MKKSIQSIITAQIIARMTARIRRNIFFILFFIRNKILILHIQSISDLLWFLMVNRISFSSWISDCRTQLEFLVMCNTQQEESDIWYSSDRVKLHLINLILYRFFDFSFHIPSEWLDPFIKAWKHIERIFVSHHLSWIKSVGLFNYFLSFFFATV